MNYTGCRPLTDEEIDKILVSCSGRYAARDRCLILVGIHTGFRVGELLSAKVSQVWNGSVVLTELTVERGFMKGRSRSRTMPLHANARAAIEDWLKDYRTGLPTILERPLFPRQKTIHAISRSKAAKMIVEAAMKAGLDVNRISTHSLRKSFARKMWDNPLIQRDMAKMARLLGHSNYSNTLRYLEFADELDKAVLTV